MRTWAKGSAPAALLAVAVMSIGSGTAVADTDGDGSIGGGNQVHIPISLPIDISGNAVGVLGESQAGSRGGASVENSRGRGDGDRTSGRHSILGGNQVKAPITAPVNACGNAVSLIGSSDAGCRGGATVRNEGRGGFSGRDRTDGDGSILGGNQVKAPIMAPVNACGNAVSLIGSSDAGCTGGAAVKNRGSGTGNNTTSGRGSILGGNQVIAPITAPINVCGNSAAVLGSAFAGCTGGAKVTGGGERGYRSTKPWRSTGNTTDGRFSILGGNQVVVPITAPINVCGNSAAVVGNATAGCTGGAAVKNRGSGTGNNTTSGRGSILGGNQVIAPITAPINVCGNAVAVLGEAFAGCRGGASVTKGHDDKGHDDKGHHGKGKKDKKGHDKSIKGKKGHDKRGRWGGGYSTVGGNRTSGEHGILAGNQVVAPITAPINVCGNSAAVLGDAAAGCLGGAYVGRPYGGYGYSFEYWSGPTGGVKGRMAGRSASAVDGIPVAGDLPIARDLLSLTGLAALPDAPGLSNAPAKPAKPVTPVKPSKGKTGKDRLANDTSTSGEAEAHERRHDAAGPLAAARPVTDLVESTPVGGVARQITSPLSAGLMSAEQPVGVTGMNAGALVALVLGAAFAFSTAMVAAVRRVRFRRG